MITIESAAYTAALYAEILLVLDSREALSDTRDRLGFYFKAKGADIGDTPATGSTAIFLGGDLCN